MFWSPEGPIQRLRHEAKPQLGAVKFRRKTCRKPLTYFDILPTTRLACSARHGTHHLGRKQYRNGETLRLSDM